MCCFGSGGPVNCIRTLEDKSVTSQVLFVALKRIENLVKGPQKLVNFERKKPGKCVESVWKVLRKMC